MQQDKAGSANSFGLTSKPIYQPPQVQGDSRMQIEEPLNYTLQEDHSEDKSQIFITLKTMALNPYESSTVFKFPQTILNQSVQCSLKQKQKTLQFYFFFSSKVNLIYEIKFHQGISSDETCLSGKIQAEPHDIYDEIKFENCRRSVDLEVIIEMNFIDVSITHDTQITLPDYFSLKGLINQGQTCYMNSLLQILSHITVFKECVYSIEKVVPGKFPASLQLLFHQLDQKDTSNAISTNDLLKSFDWEIEDAWIQQDVQEFFMMLIDALETKMKKGVMELFQGLSRTTIQCLYKDETSQNSEVFFDLQLQVKGLPSLEESLQHYCQEEKLAGENAFQSEKHGKQDAKKFTKFEKLPPIMIFHLKRFEFIGQRQKKITESYTYPEELNMDKYTIDGKPEPYLLYGVLVHRGQSTVAGHYVAYIKEFSTSTWVMFNDQTSKVVTRKEAISVGITKDKLLYNTARKEVLKVEDQSTECAYMLVYAKQAMIQELFLKQNSQIPPWISQYEKDQELEFQQLYEMTNCLVVHYLKFADLGNINGILFEKNAQNCQPSEQDLRRLKTQRLSLDRSENFERGLFKEGIAMDSLSRCYLYRLFLNRSNAIQAEQVVPLKYYLKQPIRRMANNVKISKQELFILEFDTPSRDDGVMVFYRIERTVLKHIQVDKSLKLQELLIRIGITEQVCYFSDEFYNLKKMDHSPNLTVEEFIKEECLMKEFIQLQFFNSEKDYQNFVSKLSLIQINLHRSVDDSSFVKVMVHPVIDYNELAQEIEKQTQIEKDHLLFQYQEKENQYRTFDQEILEEIISKNSTLIDWVCRFSNKLIYRYDPIPFLNREFQVVFSYFYLIEGQEVEKQVNCKKEDQLEQAIPMSKLIEDLDCSQSDVVLILIKDKQIHSIQSYESLSSWQISRFEEKGFRLVFQKDKDFQMKVKNNYRFLCNFEKEEKYFYFFFPKGVRVRDIVGLLQDRCKPASRYRFYCGTEFRNRVGRKELVRGEEKQLKEYLQVDNDKIYIDVVEGEKGMKINV